MATYTPEQLDTLAKEIGQHKISQVYLLHGERFLCQQAADKICQALLAEGGNILPVDGEQEKFTTTLNKLASFSLLPGRQVYRVTDTKLFHTVKLAESFWKKALKARQGNKSEKAAQHLRNMLDAAGLNPADPDNDPGSIAGAQWKKLFGFAKPQDDLGWTAELLAECGDHPDSATQPAGDAAALLEKTLESGIPGKNILVLLTEDVDKRKRLYKYLAERHTVVDLSVESGSSSRAQTAQKKVLLDLVQQTLAGFAKTMTKEAAELLCERVGFYPVAVVLESEKLALYTGSRTRIESADLDAVVGRTRQEALFELTDALGKGELERTLVVTRHLGEHGVHPLALIATLKNYTRSLLLFKALQEQPESGYSQSMSPAAFQQQVLPRLKKRERWKQELAGHPFALYMQFKTASGFSLATLRTWLHKILQADMRLKGSPVDPATIVEHLLIAMLAPTDIAVLQKIH